MKYTDRIVQNIKDEDISLERGFNAHMTPSFMQFVSEVDATFERTNIKNRDFYIYYEKTEVRSILCFRIKNSDSTLCLGCKTEQDDSDLKCFVRILKVEGEDAWKIAENISRFIIPFFRGMELDIMSDEKFKKLTHLVDFSTRRIISRKVPFSNKKGSKKLNMERKN